MSNAQEKISEDLVDMLDGMRGTVCDRCGVFRTSNHGISVAARLTSEMFVSRWFPISEALPNEGECVLALVDGTW